MLNEIKWENIPGKVVADVLQRIADYMSYEGATLNDQYIKRQIDYAKKFIKED